MSRKNFLAYFSASNFHVVAINFREKEKEFWCIKKSSKNLILLLFNRKERKTHHFIQLEKFGKQQLIPRAGIFPLWA